MSIFDLPQIEFERLFDLEANDAIRLAKTDPEVAAKVLQIAARYLRQQKPLPYLLADFLADAFEISMAKELPSERLMSLGFELNVKARNTRPHPFDVTEAYKLIQQNYHLVDQRGGYPNVKTKELKKLLCKKGKCSPSHAGKLLREIDNVLQKEAEELQNVYQKEKQFNP